MKVLVKNSFSPSRTDTKDVIESFWTPECLYMGPAFAMSSLMDPSEEVKLSPFLVLDAKVAFLISQLNPMQTTFAHHLGPLGLVGAHIMSRSKFIHKEDLKKVSHYLEEYLPKDVQNITTKAEKYDQVVVFGENTINQLLWNKLEVGGYYLLASDKSVIEINLEHQEFEAFGKRWPFGEPTEFGWRFKEEEWGLNPYEIVKIRKLS